MTFAGAIAPVLLLALFAAGQVHAQLRVPAGAKFALDGGRLELAGGDLEIAGELSLTSGGIDGMRHFTVPAGGSASLGTGELRLTGDWNMQGSLDAGTSAVRMLDGLPESRILGTTTFANLHLVTATGKRYRLASGNTQRVSGMLQIRGNGAPIVIDVTTPGTTAYLNLLASGVQDIANVAVFDVHATGQPLAPNATNQGGNDNDLGWFGNVAGGGAPAPQPLVVPASSPWALALLALVMGFVSFRALRRADRSHWS